MADVLIVCVREDEPRAKALAEMFEAAGFSIGGAPGSDSALRSSGAGLIVWSQASIRSRPFLDAAQRVINAGKAIVASLIEPPPPESIGDSPAFDLSDWSGDPDDPSLDPLFFAVDRMVNAARASVGAPAAQPSPASFEPPPSLRPQPAPMRPRPAPPAPQHNVPLGGQDALKSEVEHWRIIRNSRDPAVFMDYLARYGADGEFSDVAELRLKQLSEGAQTRAPQRAAPLPPQPRLEAPPPRRSEPPPPTRRPEPPPRRAEAAPPPAPPQRQRRETAPAPSYDRGPVDRAPDTREPPKGEGGALRAFVLIALLGGAALAGGLYFGGGLGDAPSTEQQQTAETQQDSAPPLGEPTTGPDLAEEAQQLSEVAPAPPTPREQAAREQARREEQRREEARREERRTAEQPRTTNTVVASNNTTSTASTGPVSLLPGSNGAANTGATTPNPNVLTPPAPQETTSLNASTETIATPPRPAPRGTVQWAQRPTARVITELYPARALRDGVGGRVELDCTILSNLALTCSILSETPSGLGFGRAALSASNSYRARPTLSDGATAVGSRARLVVQFQAPSQ